MQKQNIILWVSCSGLFYVYLRTLEGNNNRQYEKSSTASSDGCETFIIPTNLSLKIKSDVSFRNFDRFSLVYNV